MEEIQISNLISSIHYRKTLFGFGAYPLAVCERELEVYSGGMVHYLWMKVMTEQEGFWEQLEIRLS
jgi:hypothetical protein